MASAVGAFSQVSISSRFVKMTGMALARIGATIAFGSVVGNAKRSFVVSPFHFDVQGLAATSTRAGIPWP
jgi:hypothetical protein